jgi:elongation factor G
VGVKCVLNDGASHPVDSSEIAFKTAGLMGFREAYMRAKPTILEPIMLVEVQFPEEFQGAVMGQLNQRRGTILASEKQESYVVAQAEVPLNDMFGYSTDLRSATQGKGEYSMEFKRYAEVPRQQRDAMIADFKSKKDK